MHTVATYALSAQILCALPALACEAPLADPNWRDLPIRVAKDCSFDQAEAFLGTSMSASHAQEIGEGRLGQVVSEYRACGIYQSLLVVDCATREAVLVDAPEGDPPISFGGDSNREIKDLYHPRGNLRLTSKSDVAQIVAQARRHKYRHTTDVMGRINKMKRRNRYDPFCGCALYYPASEGAAKRTGRSEKKG